MATRIRLLDNFTDLGASVFHPWVALPQSGMHGTGECAVYITGTHVSAATTVILQQSHNGVDAVASVNRAGAPVQHAINDSNAGYVKELDTRCTHMRVRTAGVGNAAALTVELLFTEP